MSNWVIKLEDRRNKINKYDCGFFTLDPVFEKDINNAALYDTRQDCRDIIKDDKAHRPDVYRTWKSQKVYVYPVKVQITEV